jgi:hypothetical protein
VTKGSSAELILRDVVDHFLFLARGFAMADSDPDKDHELPDFVELELPAAEMSASSDALIGIGKVFDRGKVHGKDLSFRHTQGTPSIIK